MNYFTLEREDRCLEGIVLYDKNGEIAFEDVMNMSFVDISKNDERIQEFICAVMEATNDFFGEGDEDTVVTLVNPEGIFIWGIAMSPKEGDIEYDFIDWQKDGHLFRYEKVYEDFLEEPIDKLN